MLLGSSTARSRLVNQIVRRSATAAPTASTWTSSRWPPACATSTSASCDSSSARLVNHGVGDYLTVCVMAGAATWATGYDVAGLTAAGAADGLFVMGYDFHWSGSSRAGGVAPMQSPYTLDVAGAMADFLNETSASKLIWGVPYYGRTWPTSSSALNATTLGGGSKSYTYTGHLAQAAQFGRRWDDVGKVPWYRYWDSAGRHWVQGYYDDVASLGAKYDLINARGLAGTGMWTLLMDQGRDELWRLLANKFVHDTAPPVGGVQTMPATTDAEAFLVRWRAQDYASGVQQLHRPVPPRPRQLAHLAGRQQEDQRLVRRRGRIDLRVPGAGGRPQGQCPELGHRPGQAGQRQGRGLRAGIRRHPEHPLGAGHGSTASWTAPWPATSCTCWKARSRPAATSGIRVQYGFSEWPSAEFPLHRLDGRQPVGHGHARPAAGADRHPAVAVRQPDRQHRPLQPQRRWGAGRRHGSTLHAQGGGHRRAAGRPERRRRRGRSGGAGSPRRRREQRHLERTPHRRRLGAGGQLPAARDGHRFRRRRPCRTRRRLQPGRA